MRIAKKKISASSSLFLALDLRESDAIILSSLIMMESNRIYNKFDLSAILLPFSNIDFLLELLNS